MPIYSYLCKNCGTVFDLLVNATSDTEKQKCEKCGSNNITRIFSNFAVSSHGSGGCKNDSCNISRNYPDCCQGCKK